MTISRLPTLCPMPPLSTCKIEFFKVARIRSEQLMLYIHCYFHSMSFQARSWIIRTLLLLLSSVVLLGMSRHNQSTVERLGMCRRSRSKVRRSESSPKSIRNLKSLLVLFTVAVSSEAQKFGWKTFVKVSPDALVSRYPHEYLHHFLLFRTRRRRSRAVSGGPTTRVFCSTSLAVKGRGSTPSLILTWTTLTKKMR